MNGDAPHAAAVKGPHSLFAGRVLPSRVATEVSRCLGLRPKFMRPIAFPMGAHARLSYGATASPWPIKSAGPSTAKARSWRACVYLGCNFSKHKEIYRNLHDFVHCLKASRVLRTRWQKTIIAAESKKAHQGGLFKNFGRVLPSWMATEARRSLGLRLEFMPPEGLQSKL